MKPLCKLCGERHWGNDHVWPGVTKVEAESVTKVPDEKPAVTKLGRPRKYISNAERQRAYRKRKHG